MSRFSRFLENQRGETLITVMVAVAIGAILSLIVASSMVDMYKGGATSKFHGDAEVGRTLLQSTLRSQDICRANLGGVQFESAGTVNLFPDLPTEEIKPDANGHIPPGLPVNFRFLNSNGQLDNNNTIVKSLDFKETHYRITNISKGSNVGHLVNSTAALEVYFTSKNDVFGSPVSKRTIPIQLVVDSSTNQITNCSSDMNIALQPNGPNSNPNSTNTAQPNGNCDPRTFSVNNNMYDVHLQIDKSGFPTQIIGSSSAWSKLQGIRLTYYWGQNPPNDGGAWSKTNNHSIQPSPICMNGQWTWAPTPPGVDSSPEVGNGYASVDN